MVSPVPTFEADRLRRFEAFCDGFRVVFPRVDQYRRFRAYLYGLFVGQGRKTVEAIAAQAAAYLPAETDRGQVLHHFVSRSPWDATKLRAQSRGAIGGALADPAGVWVVHDAAFPKKGRHSVGVQRQFARPLGRKVNCQVAVVVGQTGPAGYFPLTARLYLPPAWLRDHPERVGRTVPEAVRVPASKADIALGLLDELLAEGRRPGSGVVVAETGYTATGEFLAGSAARGLSSGDSAGRLGEALAGFEDVQTVLGLSHYEGRTWAGWHHLSLVLAASAFLSAEARVAEPS